MYKQKGNRRERQNNYVLLQVDPKQEVVISGFCRMRFSLQKSREEISGFHEEDGDSLKFKFLRCLSWPKKLDVIQAHELVPGNHVIIKSKKHPSFEGFVFRIVTIKAKQTTSKSEDRKYHLKLVRCRMETTK
jgi:hypothetical protein